VESPVTSYWKIKLEDVKDALEANNFEAFVAQDVAEARKIVLDEIIPKTGAKTVSWGGSMTFIATGLYEALKAAADMEVLDTFDKGLSPEERLERRRQALMVDIFLTGTNAVTETGMLVNLDMYGNRVAGITFGPKTVIILVGRNKIVADLNDGLFRVKQYAGPANAMRLGKKTPCVKTANCEECNSPDRICNSWTITEKAFPKGRIKVVLINEDLGL
jgi:L-lactate utilization protein LutB